VAEEARSVKITCPACGTEFPVEAGLLEGDGKRLGAILADLEPVLARAALSYLRLFKPARTVLRTVRAIKLLQELLGLVRSGTVCRDERGGIQRPATAAMWIAGIEQMLVQVASLELPLSSHGYLRKVVFGLADAADAKAERKRNDEAQGRAARQAVVVDPQAGPRSLQSTLDTLALRRSLGTIGEEEYSRLVEAAKARGDGA
jgi:hypothetical protein